MTSSQSQLEASALAQCDKDPIATPGHIQPFGCLIGFDLACDKVLHCSQNIDEFLGIPASELLGRSAAEIFPTDMIHKFRNLLGRSLASTQRIMAGNCEMKLGTFNVAVHMSPDAAIVEIYRDGALTLQEGEALNHLGWFSSMIQSHDIPDLIEQTVLNLRHMSGYDRVKCYKFRPDGSGEVISEAKSPTIDSFLGLRFPAFDIPPQARALYAKTPIRINADVDADPVPILSVPGQKELDMSLAVLRGNMPVHMQYLRNMGLRATLTLPIVVEGSLWGLLAFHHREPRFLSGSTATALEFVGQMLSVRIDSALKLEQSELQTKAAELCDALFLFEGNNDAERLAWSIAKTGLKDLIPCSGIAFWHKSYHFSDGICPDRETIEELAQTFEVGQDGIAFHEQLPNLLPDAEFGETAGALYCALDDTRTSGFMFFRSEASTSVTWAGSPEKQIEIDGEVPRLTPRGSFEAYTTQMKDKCDDWNEGDINTIKSLRHAAQRKLHQRESWNKLPETVHLIQELNHRVRNILSLVQSIIRQTGSKDQDVEAFTADLEARIMSLASAHNALTLKSFRALDLHELILLEAGPFPSHQIKVDGDHIQIKPTASTLMILILHELFSNASKYGALTTEVGTVEISWKKVDGGVDFQWRERGGPEVKPPTTTGLGHRIINSAFGHELGGRTKYNYAPEGISVNLHLPEDAVDFGDNRSVTPEAPKPSDPQAMLDLGGVLILDDDFLIAQNNQMMLEEIGTNNCFLASSNASAAQIIGEETINLAVLDINLGDSTSMPTAQILTNKKIPFLFITGYDSGTMTAEAFRHIPTLRKPVHPDILSQAIDHLITGANDAQ